MHKPTAAETVVPAEVIARRAVQAAYFGFFVDMFEVYLPIAVLAPALVYFIPAGLSGATQATIFYLVFAISLIGRPLGAVIFGHFGDRVGRRQTTLISVAGFGIATLLVAALPGYAGWGEGAIAALIILRLLNGILSVASTLRQTLWRWNTHQRKSAASMPRLSMWVTRQHWFA